jgi:hypothetical protein|tara:strand:- start:187 stop:372 length:186 start_codon:yes stop_codon:yes gene_type:complete
LIKTLVFARNVFVMTIIMTALFAVGGALTSRNPDPLIEKMPLAFVVAIIIELRQLWRNGAK